METSITGRTRVFRNERQGRNGQTFISYGTSLSKKNGDGYDHAPLEIKFKRGNEPNISEAEQYKDIIIGEAFLTFRKYTTSDEKVHNVFYIMVMKYRDDATPDTAWDAIDDADIPW